MLSRLISVFRSKESLLAAKINAGACVGDWNLIYEGPFNSKIRLLQFCSVATFLSSVALSVVACVGAFADAENSQILHEKSKSINDLPLETQERINKIGFVSLGGTNILF